MKKRFVLILLFILIATMSFAQNSRGIKIKTSEGKTLSLYENSHALVIGISDYQNWRDLPNAVKDANAVAEELRENGFEVTKLTDNTDRKPNRKNILKALNDLQKKTLNDRIVLYYAGHGNSVPIPHQQGYYNGYIIPCDAQRDEISSYISMNTIKDITMMYNAKHVLYLFDSCFSGHFVDITRADSKPQSVITEKISNPVRQVISAGRADQEASDGVFHSPFCAAILDNLKNMAGDYNNDGYLTGEELAFNIRQKVEYDTRGDQTPESGKMRGFKEGDFVFAMKGNDKKNGEKEENQINLPDLKGLSLLETKRRLKSLGLKVGNEIVIESDIDENNKIVRTNPSSGKLTKGTKVDLYVSLGNVTVPDLTGLTKKEARKKLSSIGLKLGEVRKKVTNKNSEDNKIIGHTKSKDNKISIGSTVGIYIGKFIESGNNGNTPKFVVHDKEPMPFANNPKPKYTDFARRIGLEGTVILRVEVLKNGKVGAINVIKSLQSIKGGLDEQAISAVKRWKFIPAKNNGKPIAVWVTIPVNFKF